jgi:Ca2+-binding RTX toxin-like protein
MSFDTAKAMNYSWMSQASYLDLTPVIPGSADSLVSYLKRISINSGNIFSDQQAKVFANPTTGYSFINQLPNTANGTSASVFKNNADGTYAIAVRGTEPTPPFTDLLQDAVGIVAAGKTKVQLIEAYRYYKQLTTVAGQAVTYSETEVSMLSAVLLSGTPLTGALENLAAAKSVFSVLTANDTGLGKLIPDGATINFTGHSLGGHVAYLLADLVSLTSGGTHPLGDVMTYNAPGENALLYEWQNWLGLNTSDHSGVIGGKHLAFYGESGLNVTAGLGQVIGTHVPLFIEGEGAVSLENHSIVKLSDSLALYDTFNKLSPALSQNTIGDILKASSNESLKSLESSLDALRTLLMDGGIATDPAKQTPTGNRDAFYANLNALQDSAGYKALKGNAALVSLTDKPAADLITAAANPDALATRYALANLNPFALLGADYSRFNSNHELDLYDPASGEGTLTTEWIADRAAMLAWQIKLNTEDAPASESKPYNPGLGTSAAYFEDVAADKKFFLGQPDWGNINRRQFIFGDDRNSTLVGGNLDDSLYGQSGNDKLFGGAGADTLEGGRGDDILNGGEGADRLVGMSGLDVLNGGEGNDTLDGGLDDDLLIGGTGDDTLNGGKGYDSYVWTSQPGLFGSTTGLFGSNDGADTLIDSDKAGRILIDGRTVKLLLKQSDGSWKTPDGKVTLAMGDTWRLDIAGGGSLDLGTTFADGDLGLWRIEAAPEPATATTITGDIVPTDQDAVAAGIQAARNAQGGFVGTPGDYADILEGGAGNDRIAGGKLGDDLFGMGGDDRLAGGAGRDWIAGGAGRDVIEGGADGDILLGGNNDDRLYANGSIGIADAMAQGAQGTASTVQGDWLSGNVGNDILVGSTERDVLSGGSGNDLLIAGAGDDYLMGDADYTPQYLTESTPRFSVDGINWYHTNNLPFQWTVSRAGDGAPYVFAPVNIWPSEDGDDQLYAGAGNDLAWGGGGNDVIDGESGNDTLMGEAGNDALSGGTGNDGLFGDAGLDWLDGGAGDDTIDGGADADVLIGGAGADTLRGGAGKDTYFINKGDGVDAIYDDDTGAEASIMVFGPGVDPSAIKLRKGSLLIDLGNGDAVHIHNFDPDDPLANPSFEAFQFADGTTLSWNALLARGFDLDGSDGNDLMIGTALTDRMDGKGGDDVLIGGTALDGTRFDAGRGNCRCRPCPTRESRRWRDGGRTVFADRRVALAAAEASERRAT